ncbi:DoxX family protein [Azospirillum sp. B4]|uniref:DoxX family protein n=1 Tax=Azospirillum sp. B4 TaxID=95605 RepID=UPI00034A4ED6|nr:DoxX family protein [Azospirillum sp. B4]
MGPTALTPPWLRWVALLGLCAAYIQGGINKALDFGGAVAELAHFGMPPWPLLAAAVIVLELGASLLILSGRLRWLGAGALAGFTLFATFVANRYWEMAGPERAMTANAFYEHLGLVGGFLLVAWHDLKSHTSSPSAS